ncbi:tetratricopeptide repeat protein, partial [bacterium]|nr:tetratricopeptide repeat protein [bacterium]
LPEEHPHRLAVETNLAACEQQAGRWTGSLAAHRRVLDVRRRILGDDDVTTAKSWSGIGIAQVNLGRAAEACSSLAEAVRIQRLRHAEGHPARLNDERNLALARVASGDARGLDALDEVADTCARTRGADSADAAYLRVQAQWARLLLARTPTRPVDTELARLQAAEPESYRVADAHLVRLVASLLDGSDPAAALAHARALRTLRERTEVPAHPAVAEAIVAVAAAGGDAGPGLDEALRAYAEWGLHLPLLLERARGSTR